MFKKYKYITFDTINHARGENYGRRVKHYVYKDTESGAYVHEMVTLVSDACPRVNTDAEYLSPRVFWGKVRLHKIRIAYLPETWLAVAQCVKLMEKHELLQNGAD